MSGDNEMFWLVWNPGGHAPTYRHDQHGNAVNEAKRLALINPGEEFFVLQAIKRVACTEPVTVTDLDEIPF